MRKEPIEDGPTPSVKPKKKKKFPIYYKYSDGWWETVKRRLWHKKETNDWHIWKRYSSEKARDEALIALEKSQLNYKHLFPKKDFGKMYIFSKEPKE